MRIRDWSSDVCSSDLTEHRQREAQRRIVAVDPAAHLAVGTGALRRQRLPDQRALLRGQLVAQHAARAGVPAAFNRTRSEERRVGKAWVRTCGYRWSLTHYQRNHTNSQTRTNNTASRHPE